MDTNYYTGKKYYKVFTAANYRNGYEYDTGLNDLSKFIGVNGENMVCYFTDIEHIFAYLNYGPCFREVTLPDNLAVIFEEGDDIMNDGNMTSEWISNKVILGDIMIWNTKNIKYLIENGADISVCNYQIVQWSLLYNFEIFYFLQEYICSISEELWPKIIEDLQYRGFL